MPPVQSRQRFPRSSSNACFEWELVAFGNRILAQEAKGPASEAMASMHSLKVEHTGPKSADGAFGRKLLVRSKHLSLRTRVGHD